MTFLAIMHSRNYGNSTWDGAANIPWQIIQEFSLYRFGKNDQLPKEVKSKLIHLPHIIDTFASHKPDT